MTPPPGELYQAGDARLHLVRWGNQGPAVVLEAGSSDFSLTWNSVGPRLASFCQAYAYDRAGLGWSEPSSRRRTVDVMVEELRALLEAAGVAPPILLVGHSFGGLVVKLFAHRYPAAVRGLVLLDSAHEEQFVRAPEELNKLQDAMFEGFRAMLLQLAEQGRAGTLKAEQIPVTQASDAELSSRYRAVMLERPQNFVTMADEMAEVAHSHALLRREGIDSLGDLPIAVLTHGRVDQAGTAEMGISPEALAANERLWQELQSGLAGLSSQSSRQVLEGVGHMIHQERPEAVVAAVRRLLGNE